MADTVFGKFSCPCDDCGTMENVCIQYHGFLTNGCIGIFCGECFSTRDAMANKEGKVPPEIGWRKNKKEEGENKDVR